MSVMGEAVRGIAREGKFGGGKGEGKRDGCEGVTPSRSHYWCFGGAVLGFLGCGKAPCGIGGLRCEFGELAP